MLLAVTRQRADKVEDGRVVALSFTLTTEKGEERASASSDAPFVYLHGHGELLEILETNLSGREVGERFTLEIPPNEGFGVEEADPERVIPRDALGAEPVVGAQIVIEDDGDRRPAWIVRATPAHVVLRLSHPWANGTMKLDAEVLKIREATEAELERGRAETIEEAS
jgi:FKBP-type peptidyl-prolyl cis-trans isomerase SlyD